jgi:type II secretory pathway pseudopilin PulG
MSFSSSELQRPHGRQRAQMRTRSTRSAPRRMRRGFTAVEIAMVATVIAILALLILPIFRKRTEEARQAAVRDELQSLAKAYILVEADLDGFQPRLQDLDNVMNTSSAQVNQPLRATEPPYAEWNHTIGFTAAISPVATQNNRTTRVVPNWKGPYIANPKYSAVADIEFLLPDAIFPNGPVYIVGANASSPQFTDGGGTFSDDDADRYPIDPWGNPYLFFGSGRLNDDTESFFNSRVIYSMGPNGIPGDGTISPLLYLRKGDAFLTDPSTRGELGTGDDHEYIF